MEEPYCGTSTRSSRFKDDVLAGVVLSHCLVQLVKSETRLTDGDAFLDPMHSRHLPISLWAAQVLVEDDEHVTCCV